MECWRLECWNAVLCPRCCRGKIFRSMILSKLPPNNAKAIIVLAVIVVVVVHHLSHPNLRSQAITPTSLSLPSGHHIRALSFASFPSLLPPRSLGSGNKLIGHGHGHGLGRYFSRSLLYSTSIAASTPEANITTPAPGPANPRVAVRIATS